MTWYYLRKRDINSLQILRDIQTAWNLTLTDFGHYFCT